MRFSSTAGLSKWWPVSFFISSVIFLIIAIALSTKWGNVSYDKCRTAYEHHREDYDNNRCVNGDRGLLYGAVVCFIIALASFATSCVFLIVWCVRRNRSRDYQQPPPILAPQPYGHPEQGIPFKPYPPSQYPVPQYPPANYPTAPAPMYPNMHNQPAPAGPPPSN